MAILFFDDFRGYAMSDFTQVYEGNINGTTGISISTSGGRNNGPYIRFTNSSQYITKSIPTGSTFVIGAAVKFDNAVPATYTHFFQLFTSLGTMQCGVRLRTDMKLEVTNSQTTSVTDGVSALALSLDTWYYIEWKVTIANSIGAGTCVVRVNGIDWITVATGQDLQGQSTSVASVTYLGINSGDPNVSYSDFYITDGTTFLGDCTVDTLYVNGNGTTQDFDPSSGSDHSLLVDETSGNGDTDYVSTAVATERELFTMSDLAVTPSSIHAVSVWNLVRKDDAGVKKFESTIRSGGTNYDGTEAAALDTYRYDKPIWETDPATASAWSESGVNAIEAGIQVTV